MIGISLERYLDSATKLLEADPGHSENPRTVALLRRIKYSFPAPTYLDSFSFASQRMLNKARPNPHDAYSKFCQRVDHVESIQARKIYQDLGLRYRRLCCIQQRGETQCNRQDSPMHMLAL